MCYLEFEGCYTCVALYSLQKLVEISEKESVSEEKREANAAAALEPRSRHPSQRLAPSGHEGTDEQSVSATSRRRVGSVSVP
jgi:hypothetical protein